MAIEAEYKVIPEVFVDARKRGLCIDDYPGSMPEDLGTAYKIQDAGIALDPRKVGGWKVGRIPPHLTEKYGAERLAGPIFTSQIVMAADGEIPEMPILPGFAAVESEIMLRIGKTPECDLDTASAHDYVDEIRFGLEIASSPFSGINKFGPAVTVSDFGNNFGLVLGQRLSDWKEDDLMNAPVKTIIDGQQVGEARLTAMLDGPFGSVVFLNSLLRARGHSLKPGDWISTGAITGVHEISPGQEAQGLLGENISIGCRAKSYEYQAAG